jgi:hypothetical protein
MDVTRTTAENGNTHVRFGNHFHDNPPVPPGMEDAPATQWVETTYAALFKTMDAAAQIRGDGRLSDLGKSERIDPLMGDLVEGVAKLGAALDDYEREIECQEAELFLVPELHPQAAVLGQREVEIRQWYMHLSRQDRMSVLEQVRAGTLGQEVELALLRSPIGLVSDEFKLVHGGWKDRKRAESPDKVALLEAKKAALDRARRVGAALRVSTDRVTQWAGPKVLERLLDSKNEHARRGYKIFGIPEEVAATARVRRERIKNAELMGRR